MNRINQINVYTTNWDYVGQFWSACNHGMPSLGDVAYVQCFNGPLLSKDGKEMQAIKPIPVYLKLVSVQDSDFENA